MIYIRQVVHVEQGTRSHRLDVNEMVDQIVNIENETETPKEMIVRKRT